MNSCASFVITTWTLASFFVSRLARSAARCAAMEPVTPRTMFFLLISKLRWLRAGGTHLFRLDHAHHAVQILLDGSADEQVIEILPLRDLLPGDAQPLLHHRRCIRAALGQALLQDVHRRGR